MCALPASGEEGGAAGCVSSAGGRAAARPNPLLHAIAPHLQPASACQGSWPASGSRSLCRRATRGCSSLLTRLHGSPVCVGCSRLSAQTYQQLRRAAELISITPLAPPAALRLARRRGCARDAVAEVLNCAHSTPAGTARTPRECATSRCKTGGGDSALHGEPEFTRPSPRMPKQEDCVQAYKPHQQATVHHSRGRASCRCSQPATATEL